MMVIKRTDEEKAKLQRNSKRTEEEKVKSRRNSEVLSSILDAKERGDYETANELRKQLVIPAEALMAAKDVMGADWIRSEGVRTETADEKYGPDWLDR